MSGQWEVLRRLEIDGVYSLSLEQHDGGDPVLLVRGCDCAAVVDTPGRAREMAAFLARWANEQDGVES